MTNLVKLKLLEKIVLSLYKIIWRKLTKYVNLPYINYLYSWKNIMRFFYESNKYLYYSMVLLLDIGLIKESKLRYLQKTLNDLFLYPIE